MQLTIHASGENVQVLSYLLAKNPDNPYERSIKGHLVRFFYQAFDETNVKATIYVVPDSIALSRTGADAYDITHYINDREFAVSSIFLSFIRSALATALNGQPKEEYRQWVNHDFDFTFSFGPVSSELSTVDLVNLFEPLGFSMTIDEELSNKSPKYITINGKTTLQKGLRQLFILIPVIDNYKHYYIDEKEAEKLERYGEGWLDHHPQKPFIIKRSLRFKEVYAQLEAEQEPAQLPAAKRKTRLNDLRYRRIVEMIETNKYKSSIVDFGSGEGKLATKLGFINGVQEILAVEPSERESLKAVKRFSEASKDESFIVPQNIWGSLFYFDERLKNKDVMVLCEVIEHIELERLSKVMKTILSDYKPKLLIITTPNKDYNEQYSLGHSLRHADHRFEFTADEFHSWCKEYAQQYRYNIFIDGIGEEVDLLGSPTQICCFQRMEGE
ncbi:methyltransferase domain-containing protein [Cytobacillus horneckiae]|uniref:methyltransferase domain-containing protein n=1 Tax=Cytobacillus horneckiae TaxID=549687 RepID=UPI003D9A54AE